MTSRLRECYVARISVKVNRRSRPGGRNHILHVDTTKHQIRQYGADKALMASHTPGQTNEVRVLSKNSMVPTESYWRLLRQVNEQGWSNARRKQQTSTASRYDENKALAFYYDLQRAKLMKCISKSFIDKNHKLKTRIFPIYKIK